MPTRAVKLKGVFSQESSHALEWPTALYTDVDSVWRGAGVRLPKVTLEAVKIWGPECGLPASQAPSSQGHSGPSGLLLNPGSSPGSKPLSRPQVPPGCSWEPPPRPLGLRQEE